MAYWSRSFAGTPEHLTEVRTFTVSVLGDRPGVELVVLAASELAGNAILHSASGLPGGQFVLHVAAFIDRWQVRVDDDGGPNVPRLGGKTVEGVREPVTAGEPGGPYTELSWAELDDLPESGRGLALIDALSRRWGVLGDQYSRAVWAEIPFPRPEPSCRAEAVGDGADRQAARGHATGPDPVPRPRRRTPDDPPDDRPGDPNAGSEKDDVPRLRSPHRIEGRRSADPPRRDRKAVQHAR